MTKKIEKLPEIKEQQLTKAVNSIDEKQINIIVTKERMKPEDQFCFIFPSNIVALIQGKINNVKITSVDILVLIQYAERMKYGNHIAISQQTIANDLGMPRPNVTRSVTKLIKAGAMYKENGSLYMSWRFIAKGNLSNFILEEQKKQKNLSLENKIKNKENEVNKLQKEIEELSKELELEKIVTSNETPF